MPKKNSPKEDPDDLSYPPSEDIYNRLEEATEIDPEDISKKKIPIWPQKKNMHDFAEDLTGDDLDVPEYDAGDISNEDEENSYYSLGGENHRNLEEDSPEVDE